MTEFAVHRLLGSVAVASGPTSSDALSRFAAREADRLMAHYNSVYSDALASVARVQDEYRSVLDAVSVFSAVELARKDLLSSRGFAASAAETIKALEGRSDAVAQVVEGWKRQLDESSLLMSRSMASTLDALDAGAKWNAQVQGIADSFARAFDMVELALRPSMSVLAAGDGCGMLSWRALEASVLRAAAMAPAPLSAASSPATTTVRVHVVVVCAFCGRRLINRNNDQTLASGPGVHELPLEVVPLCADCLRRGQSDPSYFDKMLASFDGDQAAALPTALPRFRLIHGQGEASASSAGRPHLHLVKEAPGHSADDEDPER